MILYEEMTQEELNKFLLGYEKNELESVRIKDKNGYTTVIEVIEK